MIRREKTIVLVYQYFIFDTDLIGIGSFGEGIRGRYMLHLELLEVGTFCTSCMTDTGDVSLILRGNSRMKEEMRNSLDPS